ncbi:ABC transporter substrate-binding protein [Nesterenkonia massiliensis]|uniref:ABC transporter substrate-binding protein n=1 Tax=Nesterenkonia massiliensis TaxID=1232429 RepID=A0ABT2HSG3_9MICC|nr:ABC transporter substrate-binding protein [Nesterenkonia massiliensis]MCT1607647.1 ABC transporter substrate-binding protein [Nesterenkonia massiliensis]
MNRTPGNRVVSLKDFGRAGTVGIAAALVLTSCTPDGGESEELVWAIGGPEAQTGGLHEGIVELWNEQNPDTPVRIEALPEGAGQREQHSLVLQAEGDDFDILAVDVVWTGEYAENGWVESLEGVRDEIEAVSLAGPLESAQWGGELWAAPYNSNGAMLVYRTDLVDTPPTTWDELCEVALQVQDETDIGGLTAQGARYEGLVVNWLEYFWSAGGELYNEDQTEVAFDVELATEVLEWMAEANESGCFVPGFNTAQEDDARNEFQQGNAVFQRNWPYVYALLEEDGGEASENFEIAPLPTFTGEGTISALGGYNNAVSAFSNNKEAATDFVVWLSTDEEVQRTLAEVGSVPPTMASVYDDLADDPVMSLLGDILEEARSRPPSPAWPEISVEMQRLIFEAYNGDMDPQRAAEGIRDVLESHL